MELRNIHFATDMEQDRESPDSPSSSSSSPPTLRLRKVKVSPHEEYQLRAGEVRPISDSLAALICCRKGRAEIGPKGITVERKDIGGKRIYHHVDSKLCNDLSARERKIYYVLNSLKPDIIHLLDDTGRYLESLPEKFQPGVLNREEQERELRDQKRQVSRVARHLQELHGDDTKEAIATLTRNAEVMKGIVQVFGQERGSERESPDSHSFSSTAPAPSRLGDQIRTGERSISETRALRRDILQLGRAVSLERGSPDPHSSSSPHSFSLTPSEDWSASPVRQTTHTPTTEPIESW
jgi:hypothetical protein